MDGLNKDNPSKYNGGLYNAITLYRLSRYFRLKRLTIIAKLTEGLTHFLFNSVIPGTSKIGKGTFCSHRGIAVVIHKNSVIGENCVIGTSVVLGGRHESSPGGPIIGNRVYIGTGAKLIGAINIGDDVKIGANSVVLSDVPAGCTVVGIPAKFFKREI